MKKPLTDVAVANNQFLLVTALPERSVVFACLWGGHARRQIGHLKFLVVKTRAAASRIMESACAPINPMPESMLLPIHHMFMEALFLYFLL